MHNRPNERFSDIKAIIIGNAEAGKSALLTSLCDGIANFDENYTATIGVNFNTKILFNNTKLQIWDCAGRERFRNITKAYYRGAEIILLTYDCTNRASLDALDQFVEEIKNSNFSNPSSLLIGTKNDLKDQCVITAKEAEEKGIELGIARANCYQVSSKTGDGIDKLLTNIKNDITQSLDAEKIKHQKQALTQLATPKPSSPSFLQKHWKKILGGVAAAAILTGLVIAFWPAIIALPFVATVSHAILGIGVGLITAGISTGTGFVVDAISNGINRCLAPAPINYPLDPTVEYDSTRMVHSALNTNRTAITQRTAAATAVVLAEKTSEAKDQSLNNPDPKGNAGTTPAFKG